MTKTKGKYRSTALIHWEISLIYFFGGLCSLTLLSVVSDDCRRVHNYDEFITTFLTMLAEQNLLGDLVQHGMGYKKQQPPADSSSSSKDPPPSGASMSTSLKKNGGGANKTAIAAGSEQPGAAAAFAGHPSARSRKKKKKYAESESDWSDDDILLPVARGN